jgi:hypothetical protein
MCMENHTILYDWMAERMWPASTKGKRRLLRSACELIEELYDEWPTHSMVDEIFAGMNAGWKDELGDLLAVRDWPARLHDFLDNVYFFGQAGKLKRVGLN